MTEHMIADTIQDGELADEALDRGEGERACACYVPACGNVFSAKK